MKNANKMKLLAAGIAMTGIGFGTMAYQGASVLAQENNIVLETNAPEAAENTEFYLPDVKSITQEVMPAIVAITAESKESIVFWGREYQQDSEKAGSGVIIAKDDDELMIATNNHVVSGANDLTVLFSVDTENEKDALVPAQIKGTDSSLDLAVVAVKIADIPKDVLDKIAVAEIGDSSAVNVGDWSIAIGNALGYGQSVTFGIISALEREVTLSTDNGEIKNNMIQTDAAINFGNSGGALLNAEGQLIGINSAKASSSGVEGMGYAIPMNTAKPILEDLMNQLTRVKVDEEKAGVMGIKILEVSEEARQLYKIPAGAYVETVGEGSAAEEAGMENGDIITKIDRTTINSVNELLNRMEYYEAGEKLSVTVKHPTDHGYEEKVLELTLQAKDSDQNEKASKAAEKETEAPETAPEEEFEFFGDRDTDNLEEMEEEFYDWDDIFGYAF